MGYTCACLAEGSTIGSESSLDRKSTRLNSSHVRTSYAVFCLKKKKHKISCLESGAGRVTRPIDNTDKTGESVHFTAPTLVLASAGLNDPNQQTAPSCAQERPD